MKREPNLPNYSKNEVNMSPEKSKDEMKTNVNKHATFNKTFSSSE